MSIFVTTCKDLNFTITNKPNKNTQNYESLFHINRYQNKMHSLESGQFLFAIPICTSLYALHCQNLLLQICCLSVLSIYSRSKLNKRKKKFWDTPWGSLQFHFIDFDYCTTSIKKLVSQSNTTKNSCLTLKNALKVT